MGVQIFFVISGYLIISYSIYLWQQLFLSPHGTALLQTFPINVVATFCCAALSYIIVEKPLAGLRNRLRQKVSGWIMQQFENMAFTSRVKYQINKCLALANLRVETKTAERAEMERLVRLDRAGHFREQVFSVLTQITDCDANPVLKAVEKYEDQTGRFARASAVGGFSFSNDYFTSPDAEVAYALIRLLEPAQIIEVGSGNSTHLFREAITDGQLGTKLTSIDPSPRREIESVANKIIRRRLEEVGSADLEDVLEAGDILFIDSSHEIRPGNDVVHLFLNVVPKLRRGVVIHVHDIFLPFEYPREWIIENTLNVNWTEQYLLQAMLQGSNEFEVLWPGYYLEKTLPGFSKYFHHATPRIATSFWLRKIV